MYIDGIKKEINYIKPGEEDDDAIEDVGKAAYMAGDLQTAELKFKELAALREKVESRKVIGDNKKMDSGT